MSQRLIPSKPPATTSSCGAIADHERLSQPPEDCEPLVSTQAEAAASMHMLDHSPPTSCDSTVSGDGFSLGTRRHSRAGHQTQPASKRRVRRGQALNALARRRGEPPSTPTPQPKAVVTPYAAPLAPTTQNEPRRQRSKVGYLHPNSNLSWSFPRRRLVLRAMLATPHCLYAAGWDRFRKTASKLASIRGARIGCQGRPR